MTSPAKIESNRRNARRSTGPRTAAGRLKSRLNALSHGLRSMRHSDAGSDEAVCKIAAGLCGPNDEPEQVARAYMVGEAEVMLDQVRSASTMILDQLLAALNAVDDADMAFVTAQISRLRILHRYERQAHRRRDNAFAAFLKHRSPYRAAPLRLRDPSTTKACKVQITK